MLRIYALYKAGRLWNLRHLALFVTGG